MKLFAERHPDWRSLCVDPSTEMLALARTTLGPLASHVDFHEGYIDTAPVEQFDAATYLLTLHFVPAAERLRTPVELRRRLKPGAPLAVAHHSFPQSEGEKARWLARYAAFAIVSGAPATKAGNAIEAIGAQLPILSPKEDEALLEEAGFGSVELFYAGFMFKGWVAYAPS